ncbi:MAG: tripartite tricarboxylate transporter permease [Chloroflexota bacterium]|jgi:putative tricarboxylic transport membrane protein
MENFLDLMGGFATALSLQNLLFALLGCLVGTMIGVLPGIGSAGGIAILIPITFNLPPMPSIIMLAAIFYGAQYGGTISSVLVNVPGEASTAITCIEGHPMAKSGRAGVALSMAAIGSFIGGTLAMLGLVIAAPPLARMTLEFGPPEMFSLMVVGLSLVTGLAGRSILKALMMAALGLVLAAIGMDPSEGVPRLTFGQMELLSGLDFVPVIMGLFGVGDVLLNAEKAFRPVSIWKMHQLIPAVSDLKLSSRPIARGTVVGFLIGLIPGTSATIASFMSYSLEKRLSRQPERFGTGVIEGVAGPETANNAYASAALIPLFTLGIPGSATIAVLMGAFMMNGLTPGPLLFVEHKEFVWALIASLFIGNVMLIILNLPLIPLWVSLLRIPYAILFALILVFTLIGAYSIDNSVFDIGTMVLFGVLGYIFKKLDFPLAPIVLTLILGPLMERYLRSTLQMSVGDPSILIQRPLSAMLLILAAVIVLTSGLKQRPSAITQDSSD